MRGDSPPPTAPPASSSSPFGGSGGELFESGPSPLVFLPLLLIQGGGMDLSRVGERLLSSVRSARSLGIIPPTPAPAPSRPEVPARAAAAAAAARAIAGLPPHERINLPSNSEDLVSIYGSNPQGPAVDELEEVFYEEEFDPIKYILANISEGAGDATYFDKQSTLRLAQLDKIAERLSHHVMGHHEEMVKGMQLVMELEQDLKVANVICMNGRRHISSSKNEVSRDLVVNVKSKKKQALLDVLPVLTELRHAQDMQMELETFVEKENYFQAFQLLPEYLQILENYSGLSAVQEMGRGIEAWLARTIRKLDNHLLGVCQTFSEESYLTVIDAFALMGDIGGMAEKMQSFFLQEVLSRTHIVLKEMLEEEVGNNTQRNRFTYSDLCVQVPESKLRPCLLKTLESIFSLMRSYYAIMSFCPEVKNNTSQSPSETSADSGRGHSSAVVNQDDVAATKSDRIPSSSVSNPDASTSGTDAPFYQLRTDATKLVAYTFERGRRNLWQLATSRLSALLACSAVSSTSIYQFLKNYEDLTIFILAGEAFCGFEASEFRQKLKTVCLNYIVTFHANHVLWWVSVALMVVVSITYLLKVVFYFEAVRREFHHPVRVNFFFAPWIACLFLVKGVPHPVWEIHHAVWYLLMAPILCLDLKIYGQWMSSGERRLSKVANPSNHLAVVGNFVGALLGARMGLRELPIFFFAVGLAHYAVLFVTLYQRLPTNVQLPKELHPVFFLFVAAPSVASMAWSRISGEFSDGAKLLYFVSLFLYVSLVVRVNLFRGFKFSLAWWAYTFPMTSVALATVLYASKVDNVLTRAMAVGLSGIAVVTVTAVLATTVYHAFVRGDLFPNDVSIAITRRRPKFSKILAHLRSSSSDAKELVLSIPNSSSNSNSKQGVYSDNSRTSSCAGESPVAHGPGRSEC